MLESKFVNYPKGDVFHTTIRDFLGDNIFNANGENWKFQRQLSSHRFNTRSLRKFVETVVDSELSDWLVPTLDLAGEKVIDFQDILQRFAFDNICKIAFGYDPAYLLPSLPESRFAAIFESALHLTSERFNSNVPLTWRFKKYLRIGKEKDLKDKIHEVREFVKKVMREKKHELGKNQTLAESEDLLSTFLTSGHSDEEFVVDVVICFILTGRDITSAALMWFFWLIHNHPAAENQILKEMKQSNNSDQGGYNEVKTMIYTYAALCEAMCLYPPVPVSTKWAADDDVLQDGTTIKKGTRISYHPYVMGRVEKVWGADWAEFRPERWLEWETAGKWTFVGRDPYTYSVFQAGPRICLGKDMAFLQMKRVVAGSSGG